MIAPLVFSSMIGDGDFLERLLVAQNTMKIFNMCKMDARIINLNNQNIILEFLTKTWLSVYVENDYSNFNFQVLTTIFLNIQFKQSYSPCSYVGIK